jgi:hypothetical protein
MRVIEQLHNLTELTLCKNHFSKSDRFEYGPDRIKRLAQFEKLTKLHLTGHILKGNWLHFIC